MTRQRPHWLEAKGDGKNFKFVLKDKPVTAIRRMCEEAVSGMGKRLITSRLNAADVPPRRVRMAGTTAQSEHLLHDRRLIGEFQPMMVIPRMASRSRMAIRSPTTTPPSSTRPCFGGFKRRSAGADIRKAGRGVADARDGDIRTFFLVSGNASAVRRSPTNTRADGGKIVAPLFAATPFGAIRAAKTASSSTTRSLRRK